MPYATFHNYQNTLIHKNEFKVNTTLITMSSWYRSLEQGPLGPIGVLAPLESNFEVDYIVKSLKVQHLSTIGALMYLVDLHT